jgi:hypothetical protein
VLALGADGTASVLEDEESEAAGAVEVAAASLLDGATAVDGALPLPLKSVAYQPDPLSWNPAAVTCFLNSGLLQEGHTSSGASDIFCNTSLANPQESHL